MITLQDKSNSYYRLYYPKLWSIASGNYIFLRLWTNAKDDTGKGAMWYKRKRLPNEYLRTGKGHPYSGDKTCVNSQIHGNLFPNILEHELLDTADNPRDVKDKASFATWMSTYKAPYEYKISPDFVHVQEPYANRWSLCSIIPVRRYFFMRSPTTGLGKLCKLHYYPLSSTKTAIIYEEYNYYGSTGIQYYADIHYPYGIAKQRLVTISYTAWVDGFGEFVAEFNSQWENPHMDYDPGGILSQDLNPDDYTGSCTGPHFKYDVSYDKRALHSTNVDKALIAINQVLVAASVNSLAQEVGPYRWGELALQTIENMKSVSVNNIAYLRDLKLLLSEITSLIKVIENPLSIKNWSDLWLGYRYGTRLAVSDTKKNIEALQRKVQSGAKAIRKSFLRSRAMETYDLKKLYKCFTSASRELHYKVYYQPRNEKVLKAWKALSDAGLDPDMVNIWDLIPFSFTLDWIVDISGFLETIDADKYRDFIRVLHTTFSVKDTYMLSVDLSSLYFQDTDLVATLYHRRILPILHQYSRILTWGSASGVNVVDAVTLIISNKK